MGSDTLSVNIRTRLSVMMFLEYAFNGIWFIPLAVFLGSVKYSDVEIGTMYGTFAIAFMIAPFFVGMVADRFFAAQKVLGVINLLSAGLLVLAAQVAVSAKGTPQPHLLFWVLLAHCICYTPTWALTNTIALSHMNNPGKQFPSIRVMGTIGWIAVSAVCLFDEKIMTALGVKGKFGATSVPMYIGAGIGVVMGIYSFFLPNTPPKATGHKVTFGDILGVKALALFKDRNFLIFALSSFLILFPAIFYWVFCNPFLEKDLGMQYAQFKQSIGQMAELVFLFLMPWFFARVGVKIMMLIGMVAWILRFTCFSYGNMGSMSFLLYLGLALHGVCFDFFFVTGQLYTDKKAPKEVQASAQGLIQFITFGVGWFLGSNVAGRIVDLYVVKDAAGATINHNWHVIWLYPAAMAVGILIFFLLFFKDNMIVGHKPEAETPAQPVLNET